MGTDNFSEKRQRISLRHHPHILVLLSSHDAFKDVDTDLRLLPFQKNVRFKRYLESFIQDYLEMTTPYWPVLYSENYCVLNYETAKR